MQDLSAIVKIKEAAEADLLERPGLTAVDVGYKYVGGLKSDEIAISVHVTEKKNFLLRSSKHRAMLHKASLFFSSKWYAFPVSIGERCFICVVTNSPSNVV